MHNLCPTGLSARAEIIYDFDDGTLQGWETLLPEGEFPERQILPFDEVLPMRGAGGAESGTFYLTGVPIETRDDPHDTFYIWSPEFVIDNSGPLTFFLGGGPGSSALPFFGDDVIDFDSVSSTSGYQGIALRRESDDEFVLTKRRSGQGNVWQELSFTAEGSYTVKSSSSPSAPDNVLGSGLTIAADDEVPGDGDRLTKTFNLEDAGLGSEPDLFFVAEEE